MNNQTFKKIFTNWNWKPIRNCPGRFIFADGSAKLTANEIADMNSSGYKFQSKKVTDEVLVIKFNDDSGGLISYLKTGNKFLHTLNDKDGFERKLRQLEILLPDID